MGWAMGTAAMTAAATGNDDGGDRRSATRQLWPSVVATGHARRVRGGSDVLFVPSVGNALRVGDRATASHDP
jgi:hypothetical protein